MLPRTRTYTERVVQFGTGNFLRAFVDWQLDIINEHTDFDAGIVMLKSTDSARPSLNEQDGLYTVLLRGLDSAGEVVDEARLIQSVTRQADINEAFDAFLALARDPNIEFVFSNTTEAGIRFEAGDKLGDAPPDAFPAKLTRFLFERYQAFSGDETKGLTIIPCELIDHNGDTLRGFVQQYAELWDLPDGFGDWLERANTFCNTLVDRIVTGYPADAEALLERLGYDDAFLTVGEPYYFFAIQGPENLARRLHLDKVDLPHIHIVDDITPFKTRKVGILNGAHTLMVPVAYLCGLDTVRGAIEHRVVNEFVRDTVFDDIIPALPLPEGDLRNFAEAVFRRFRNPFVEHKLLDISLNSVAKFKTRLLPQLLTHSKSHGDAPLRLSFALAALVAFYKGKRAGASFTLRDSDEVLAFFRETWRAHEKGEIALRDVVERVLGHEPFWERDLREVKGLSERVTMGLEHIEAKGMVGALEALQADSHER